ncbi:MAG TPA: DUF350 domain-containing protein [Gallionellaceae bacterium]
MNDFISMKYVVSALLFSGIGLGVYILAFVLLDVLTPKVNIWREIVEKQNVSVAILMGACMLGIAIIIGSAIHG